MMKMNGTSTKSALPLCYKTMQMVGFLNTDPSHPQFVFTPKLCPRLVKMLKSVLGETGGVEGAGSEGTYERTSSNMAALLYFSIKNN